MRLLSRFLCLCASVLWVSCEPQPLARLWISLPSSPASTELLELRAGEGVAEVVAEFCKERLPCTDSDRRALQDELWNQIHGAGGSGVEYADGPRKAPELLRIPVEVLDGLEKTLVIRKGIAAATTVDIFCALHQISPDAKPALSTEVFRRIAALPVAIPEEQSRRNATDAGIENVPQAPRGDIDLIAGKQSKHLPTAEANLVEEALKPNNIDGVNRTFPGAPLAATLDVVIGSETRLLELYQGEDVENAVAAFCSQFGVRNAQDQATIRGALLRVLEGGDVSDLRESREESVLRDSQEEGILQDSREEGTLREIQEENPHGEIQEESATPNMATRTEMNEIPPAATTTLHLGINGRQVDVEMLRQGDRFEQTKELCALLGEGSLCVEPVFRGLVSHDEAIAAGRSLMMNVQLPSTEVLVQDLVEKLDAVPDVFRETDLSAAEGQGLGGGHAIEFIDPDAIGDPVVDVAINIGDVKAVVKVSVNETDFAAWSRRFLEAAGVYSVPAVQIVATAGEKAVEEYWTRENLLASLGTTEVTAPIGMDLNVADGVELFEVRIDSLNRYPLLHVVKGQSAHEQALQWITMHDVREDELKIVAARILQEAERLLPEVREILSKENSLPQEESSSNAGASTKLRRFASGLGTLLLALILGTILPGRAKKIYSTTKMAAKTAFARSAARSIATDTAAPLDLDKKRAKGSGRCLPQKKSSAKLAPRETAVEHGEAAEKTEKPAIVDIVAEAAEEERPEETPSETKTEPVRTWEWFVEEVFVDQSPTSLPPQAAFKEGAVVSLTGALKAQSPGLAMDAGESSSLSRLIKNKKEDFELGGERYSITTRTCEGHIVMANNNSNLRAVVGRAPAVILLGVYDRVDMSKDEALLAIAEAVSLSSKVAER